MVDTTVAKTRPAKSFSEKISTIEQQIEIARERYEKLLTKRKGEIGQLALDAGLCDVDDKLLLQEFKQVERRLRHGNGKYFTQKSQETIADARKTTVS